MKHFFILSPRIIPAWVRKGPRFMIRVLILHMVLAGVGAVGYGAEEGHGGSSHAVKGGSSTAKDSLLLASMFDRALYLYDVMDDEAGADSVSGEAMQLAGSLHRPELFLYAAGRYVRSNDLRKYGDRALVYAQQAADMATLGSDQRLQVEAGLYLAEVYLSGYRYDKALDIGYRSLSQAMLMGDPTLSVSCYLLIGRSLEGKNQKIEAFRNYLAALGMAETAGQDSLKAACYSRLSQFYRFGDLFGKALHYKLLERDLVAGAEPVDSNALMWITYDLQLIGAGQTPPRFNTRDLNTVLSFATRHNHRRMLNYQIALYRTYLVDAGNISELKHFYLDRYPAEWSRLRVESPGFYYRLKALICEHDAQYDSAFYYFHRAEALLATDPNPILRSKFYYRYGQFLVRHGEEKKAIEKFNASYEMAAGASYLEYMLLASNELETQYAKTGDFKNAWHFSVLNRDLSDSINTLSRRDRILSMEIDHETRQREIHQARQAEQTTRRHYLQYSAMIIGILSVFVILIMLGSLKVPAWIIRSLGFFSFIFLFEFIILLADQTIHHATHGEPWKILLIKIGLIAILLPLHHAIEKRVIAYLLNHRLLDLRNLSFISRIRAISEKMSRK